MVLDKFIVFEGIDGSGTSTQIQRLVNSDPKKFAGTCEPTTGETGKFIRRMLGGEFEVNEKTASYLFAADRCEHIFGKEGVINLLNKNKIVVSDRYFFSSLAYQSISCGSQLPKLINSPFPLPQLLFFFEIDPEISLSRVNSRNEKKEIYEKLDLQKKIAKQYEKIISHYEKHPDGMIIIRIDATKPIDEIAAFIRSKIYYYLESEI